jgi:hypothetical protein
MDPDSLSVPAQHHYNDPTVERDAGRLRVWLTNLPLLDVVKSLRLVQGALDSLNEQQLAPEKRYELLEVFRDTAERLYATVDPVYMRQLNLTSSQRELATAGLDRLLTAMAGGYKILVKALFVPAHAGLPPELFGLALARAIGQLGYILRGSYRAYRAVPASLFRELHQLYRYARHFGLLAVTASGEDTGQPLGIAESYHAIMLLSLTDPFRLAEGEVGLLYEILKTHAGLCRITPGGHWQGDAGGVFLLDLVSDDPPGPLALPEQEAAFAEEPYLLDARSAIDAIRAQLERIPAKVRMQSPEAVLLRHLAPGAEAAWQNREPRRAEDRSAWLVYGLDAIHARLLASATENGAATGNPARDTGTGLLPCRIVDTSANGMRLVWDEGRSGDARVGDLLGVVEAGHRLQVVVIRSVQVYREAGVELGVQKIHGSCGPVCCRASGGQDTEEVRALFIPASAEENAGATLVTAKGCYEAGRRLVVNSLGRTVQVRAGRNLSDSLMFDRFEFSADDS